MPKLSIRDLDLTDKRVLIRVDFNVPLKDGIITDDTRIRETLPTIEYALRHKAKVILCSHLGRPKGKPVESMSLRPLVAHLRGLLDHILGDDENVAFSPDCVGAVASEMAANLESGQPLLLENLRFHPEEEANDPAFAKKLASLCDIYVNDAFGSAHRAHASTEGITHFVKVSAAGLLMEKELTYLGKALTEPDKPFVAIIGGAKVSDKIDVIDNLLDRADAIIIGGGMAYTFLNAQGQSTGKSLVETDKIDVAKAALKKAETKGVRFLLPVDHVLADKFAPNAKTRSSPAPAPSPPNGWPSTSAPNPSASSKTRSPKPAPSSGTAPWASSRCPPSPTAPTQIAKAVARNHDATTIVGGGDSVAAIQQSGVADRITHISTGGGASLEFLEGKTLPGVAALTDNQRFR